MSKFNAFKAIGKYLTQAYAYINDPKKLSRLLKSVKAYARSNSTRIKKFMKDILLMWEILAAWYKGEYKEIPKKSILLIIGALIYFISPLDIIPDVIAPWGFLDDAAVIGWVIQSISVDISKFKLWKAKRKGKQKKKGGKK